MENLFKKDLNIALCIVSRMFTVAPDIFSPMPGMSRVSFQDKLKSGNLKYEPINLGARVQVDAGVY